MSQEQENKVGQEESETESPAQLTTKPTETSFQLFIDINQQEDESWKAQMKDGDITWEGTELTPLNSVRNLLQQIEIKNLKTQEDQAKTFMKLNFDNAKALVLQLAEILGKPKNTGWFSIYDLQVKTSMPKQEIVPRLKMLKSFGLLELEKPDGSVGNRFKIVRTRAVQQKYLSDKIELHKKEIEMLEFQLSEIMLNEPVEKQLDTEELVKQQPSL